MEELFPRKLRQKATRHRRGRPFSCAQELEKKNRRFLICHDENGGGRLRHAWIKDGVSLHQPPTLRSHKGRGEHVHIFHFLVGADPGRLKTVSEATSGEAKGSRRFGEAE